MRFLIAFFVLLCGCVTLRPHATAYEQACRYPMIHQAKYFENISPGEEWGNKFYRVGQDVDHDNKVDVFLVFMVTSQEIIKGEVYDQLTPIPIMFGWVGDDGKVYAYQHDNNIDRKIESVSGDAHRLNEALDKLQGK